MPFPFYVKPAKAAFSVLARRVNSFEELYRHTRFGWFEHAIIERLVRPYADVMRAHSELTEDSYSMVCEEILPGPQVTANGLVRGGQVTMFGTVDSIMYPGTDQFQRFQYPSALPPEQLARVDALARRLIEGVGFAHGMFNVEMRIDPAAGLSRWPKAAEVSALKARHPDIHAMVYLKRGPDLAREMKWLGSYRYRWADAEPAFGWSPGDD